MPSYFKDAPSADGEGFIEGTTRLPDIGQVVEVRGEYVAPGTGYPKSSLRVLPAGVRWSSTEWRGMVGVTHWRPARQRLGGSE